MFHTVAQAIGPLPHLKLDAYFLTFLLNPARPINSDPNSSMLAGSGTGAELECVSTVIDGFDPDTSCCLRSVLFPAHFFPIWYVGHFRR
jgi:hypothetical protein